MKNETAVLIGLGGLLVGGMAVQWWYNKQQNEGFRAKNLAAQPPAGAPTPNPGILGAPADRGNPTTGYNSGDVRFGGWHGRH